MSSLIKIAYNDIAHLAQSITCANEDASHLAENLFYGGSTTYWQRDAAGTSTDFIFILPSGITRSVEYVYLRNVKPLLALTQFRIQIYGSANNFAASTLVLDTGATLISAPNAGAELEDYFLKGSLSTAFRYWKVTLTTADSVVQRLSKILFGSLFDFPRAPVYPYSRGFSNQTKGFEADSGAIFLTAHGRAKRNYQLKWTHFSGAIRDDFEDRVGRFLKNYPIALIENSDSEHAVIKNKTTFGFAEYNISSPVWKDIHHLELSFYEDSLG